MIHPGDDARQREQAIEPTRSCIVQAPAGSGKTELLIQRFLGLLAEVEQPREVLAITFTRKAAAEMRRRVLAALDLACLPRPQEDFAVTTWALGRRVLDRDRDRAWGLRDNPAQLQILTIDSFNANLARQLPWSSGLGGVPRIEEDPSSFYRQAVRRVLGRLAEGEHPAAAVLLRHLDNRFDRLAQLLETLLANRDQWLPLLLRHSEGERRAQLEETLRRFVEFELQRLTALIPEAVSDAIPRLAAYAAGVLGEDGWPGLNALADLGRAPRASADDHAAWQGLAGLLLTEQGHWRRRLDKRCGFPPGSGLAAECKDLLLQCVARLDAVSGAETQLALVRALPPIRYDDRQWDALEALIAILPLAVAELWRVFDGEGAVDFIEVGVRGLSALGQAEDPSELLLKLDARLRHILVDEFQDTSRLQWLLLERLTSGWERDDGRTLYLVGDPMQSIYRFREAEVGLFLRARAAGLGGIALQPLQLQSNFRTRPQLMGWINATFAQIFPPLEDEGLGAVPYAGATARRPYAGATAVVIHPRFGRDDRAEAEQVVALVRQTLATRAGNVAVLVRARSHLTAILAALRQAGLRCQGRDLDPLAARPAASDLVALTRALLHPADRLHWLALLRAPWCGLPLGDLQVLAGDPAGPATTLPQRLADDAVLAQLSDEGRPRVLRVRQVLLSTLAARGRVGLRHLIEGCWLALGGPCCVDAAGLDDAAQVLVLLEELDAGGDLFSWQLLQDRLERLFAAPDPLADGRLQVMTIHKAKGLEFDTVILPGLGRKPRRGAEKLLRWIDHPSHGLLLAPLAPADGSSRDPLYDAIGRLEQQKDDHETLRLLYVAVTRAREELHLLGHARIARDGTAQAEAGSLLAQLWPVCRESFTPPAAAGEGAEVPAPPQPALTRLPLHWQLPELAAAAIPPAVQIEQPSRQALLFTPFKDFSDRDAEVGRAIGTVMHLWLERLAATGVEGGLPDDVEARVHVDLHASGLPGHLLKKAQETILNGLRTVLAGPRGRWLLAPHTEAACELPLSGQVDGSLVHAVIDRTFVERGVRWVIDYKTGSPGTTAVPQFLAGELERYRAQLELYVRLCQQFDPGREVRAALYFPTFDGWVELERASLC